MCVHNSSPTLCELCKTFLERYSVDSFELKFKFDQNDALFPGFERIGLSSCDIYTNLDITSLPSREPHFTCTLVLSLKVLIGYFNEQIYWRKGFKTFIDNLIRLKNINGQQAIEIILWSASDEPYIRHMLSWLDPDHGFFNYVVSHREIREGYENSFVKDLRKLGRSNCILLDTDITASRENGINTVIVPKVNIHHDLVFETFFKVIFRAVKALHFLDSMEILYEIPHAAVGLLGAGSRLDGHFAPLGLLDFMIDNPYINVARIERSSHIRYCKLLDADSQLFNANIIKFRVQRIAMNLQFEDFIVNKFRSLTLELCFYLPAAQLISIMVICSHMMLRHFSIAYLQKSSDLSSSGSDVETIAYESQQLLLIKILLKLLREFVPVLTSKIERLLSITALNQINESIKITKITIDDLLEIETFFTEASMYPPKKMTETVDFSIPFEVRQKLPSTIKFSSVDILQLIYGEKFDLIQFFTSSQMNYLIRLLERIVYLVPEFNEIIRYDLELIKKYCEDKIQCATKSVQRPVLSSDISIPSVSDISSAYYSSPARSTGRGVRRQN